MSRKFSDGTMKEFKSNYVHPKPIRKRCTVCGHKITGENHENGEHHIRKKKS